MLVVRKGCQEFLPGKARRGKQLTEALLAVSARPGVLVVVLDAMEWSAQVIFWRSCQVLKAQLVFNRENQYTVGFQQRPGLRQ